MTTRRMEPPLQERELTPDERAVLSVYAAAESPLASFEAAWVLNPRPGTTDGRTRKHKAWVLRQNELMPIPTDLYLLGYLYLSVETDGCEIPNRLSITDAGRKKAA